MSDRILPVRGRVSSVGDNHRKFVFEEKYMKSACEDLTCDLKNLCVLKHILGICVLMTLL
jgi:hypothetical protein